METPIESQPIKFLASKGVFAGYAIIVVPNCSERLISKSARSAQHSEPCHPLSLSLRPVEILEEIVKLVSLTDVFALARVFQQLYAGLIRTLYLERSIVLTVLTTGLQDVPFWFDKSGNSSVVEWAVVHGRICTLQRLLFDPGMDLLQVDKSWSESLFYIDYPGKVSFHTWNPLLEGLCASENRPRSRLNHSLLTPLTSLCCGSSWHDRSCPCSISTRGLCVCRQRIALGTHPSLHLASVTGSHQVFARPVQAGTNANSESRFGWTSLMDQASISHHHHTAVDEVKRLWFTDLPRVAADARCCKRVRTAVFLRVR